MRALTYHGSHDVKVDNVPDPSLQDPDDVILRVTATAICGSDLHMYRGKMPAMKSGDILGHEFMGEVVDAGPSVTKLHKGDRVVVPFVIACGSCFFCERQLFSACESTNPDRGAILNKKSLRPGAALFGWWGSDGLHALMLACCALALGFSRYFLETPRDGRLDRRLRVAQFALAAMAGFCLLNLDTLTAVKAEIAPETATRTGTWRRSAKRCWFNSELPMPAGD